MKHACIAAFATAVLSVSAADARSIKTRLDVNPTSQTTFEVIENFGAGPNQIWCAAADYAFRVLNQRRGRIYVSTPRGPAVTVPGMVGVGFSSQPIPGVSGRATNSIREVGANLTVSHAIQFCRDDILDKRDR